MPQMKKVEVGEILIQDNQDRKFGADPQYAVIWATEMGDTFPLALTKKELTTAITRAAINPEDIPELGSESPVNHFDD